MSCPLGVSQPREEDTGMWLKMEHGQSIEGHSGTLVSSFGGKGDIRKVDTEKSGHLPLDVQLAPTLS